MTAAMPAADSSWRCRLPPHRPALPGFGVPFEPACRSCRPHPGAIQSEGGHYVLVTSQHQTALHDHPGERRYVEVLCNTCKGELPRRARHVSFAPRVSRPRRVTSAPALMTAATKVSGQTVAPVV